MESRRRSSRKVAAAGLSAVLKKVKAQGMEPAPRHQPDPARKRAPAVKRKARAQPPRVEDDIGEHEPSEDEGSLDDSDEEFREVRWITVSFLLRLS